MLADNASLLKRIATALAQSHRSEKFNQAIYPHETR
jgi:hypothetical protein